MSAKVTSTRLQSDHYMIGQQCSDLGVDSKIGKLPLTKSVMKYLFFRKNLPNFKYKSVKLAICCPMNRTENRSNCDNNPDCKENEECVVKKVNTDGNWIASGIPIISDYAISQHLIVLNDMYKKLNKKQ